MITAATAMDLAREKATRLSGLHAFISLSDEGREGLPLAVKDLIDVRGMVTTGGASVAGRPAATRDAEVVRRLRRFGWNVLGKTNLHEWALGPTSGNPHYGAVLNPRNPERVAGGSSGGSAAAVAAGITPLALGTDTGGSIRIPSALCGITGMRPSLGLLPLDGIQPLSVTCDTVGPMAADVSAISEAMVQLGGIEKEPEPLDAGELKLAIPGGWVNRLDRQVAAAWAPIARDLPEVEMPDLDSEVLPVGLTILYREAHDQHGRQLAERPESLGDDLRELLARGSRIGDAEYEDAMARREVLVDRFTAIVGEFDAVITPTTATVAPPVNDSDPIAVRDALTCFTRPWGATGFPGISLPAPGGGLPVGIQLVGIPGSDSRLLQVADALERDWQKGDG